MSDSLASISIISDELMFPFELVHSRDSLSGESELELTPTLLFGAGEDSFSFEMIEEVSLPHRPLTCKSSAHLTKLDSPS